MSCCCYQKHFQDQLYRSEKEVDQRVGRKSFVCSMYDFFLVTNITFKCMSWILVQARTESLIGARSEDVRPVHGKFVASGIVKDEG